MFKRTIAALTAACLVGLGVIGLASPAGATGGGEQEVCYGTPIHHDEEGYWQDGPLITPADPGHPETFTTVAGPWYVWAPTVADGPQDYTPNFPTDDERGKWVGPKTEGGPDRTEEGTFNVSHGQSGNSSWFHRGPSTQVSNNDYVAPTEAVYGDDEWIVTAEAYDEEVIVPCDEPTILREWHTWQSPTWAPDANDASDVGWPQTHVLPNGEPGEVPLPDECEVTYQYDLYVGTRAEIDAVLDNGTLEGYPPAEDADVVEDWYFASTGECPPGVIDWPTPQVNDVCGPANATWVLPTGDDRISWQITEDGRLIGEIIAADLTWPSGLLVNSWGTAPDSGEICPPTCEDQDVPVWHTWTGGPIGSDEGPAADAEGWNANSGNPQSANHAFANHEAGVPYFVSHGNSGKGDWFLWTLEDCPPPPVEPGLASASWNTLPPTCDDLNGSGVLARDHATLVAASLNGEEYTNLADFAASVHNDPAPSDSDWTLTFQADPGYLFANGTTNLVVEFHVDAYKTLDDWDCRGDKPHKIVTKTDECVEPGFRAYTITVTRYVWDFETHSWVLGEPEVVKTWTKSDESCDVLVPVQFNVEPTPAFCDADGEFDTSVFPIDREGYTLDVDRDFDGPGEYVITATAKPGFAIEGEISKTVTVDAGFGFQSEDPEADCYLPPPPPEECVDINSASLDDLARITGLGGEGILAQRVIDGRPWASIDDLIDVDGIGPVTLAEIKADEDLCPTETPEPTVVTPTNPTVVDACGPNNLVITLPANTAEITYSKDGNVVTATAADGFVFFDGEETYTSWVWDDITDSNTPCPVTPASNPLTPVHLAATGSEGALALAGIAALLLLVGGSAAVVGARRK